METLYLGVTAHGWCTHEIPQVALLNSVYTNPTGVMVPGKAKVRLYAVEYDYGHLDPSWVGKDDRSIFYPANARIRLHSSGTIRVEPRHGRGETHFSVEVDTKRPVLSQYEQPMEMAGQTVLRIEDVISSL